MAHVNSLSVPAYSDLTTHSPDTRSPYRRIHFPILQSQQGRRELFLPSAEDRPISPDTIMAASDLTRLAWPGCAFRRQDCSGRLRPYTTDASYKWLPALAA